MTQILFTAVIVIVLFVHDCETQMLDCMPMPSSLLHRHYHGLTLRFNPCPCLQSYK